jgi:putative peptide zinc metalloprotease protein
VQVRPQLRSADGESRDWLSEPLRGREDIEFLRGLDGRPLLYDPRRRQYVLVSPAGAGIVGLLDGHLTGYELADLAGGIGVSGHHQPEDVLRFLTELRDAGLLDGWQAMATGKAETLGWIASGARLLVRLPLTISLSRPLEQICRLVDRIPRVARLSVLLLVTALLPLCVAAALAQGHSRPPVLLWMLLPLSIAQMVSHELSHAFMCQRYGVPVRDAGVGLLFNLVPVAYVDRTDAYRLRERRQRVFIALAGPFNDLLWAGAYAVLSLSAHGDAAQLGQWGLLLALVVVANNLNPLMPSDGFQALEAGLGFINLRGRVIATLVGSLRPGHSATTTGSGGSHRFMYLGLAIVWVLYLSTVAVTLIARSLSLLPGASQ